MIYLALQLLIQKFQISKLAEVGTNTTSIKITNHGLETGDIVVNQDRRFITNYDPCSRIITKVDADTFTIPTAITGQTTGDTIRLYKYVDRTSYLKVGSLNVSNRADKRNNCQFTFILPDATYLPHAGQNVKVMYDNNIIFGGSIKFVNLKRLGTKQNYRLQAEISSEGYNHIPGRRTVTVNYPSSTTSKQIVKDMVDSYLAQEGITYVDLNLGTGYTWDEYPTDTADNCKAIKDILDDMANASGYKWYIDNNRVLNFLQDDSASAAPHSLITDGVFSDYRDITIEESLINYRNKQFVRGGTDEIYGDVIVSYAESISEAKNRQDVEAGSGVYGAIYEDTNIETVTEKTAESGTTTTNIKITGHGMVDGDMLVNISRNNAKRIITKVDNDNVTVDSVSSQTTGDKILIYYDANAVAQNNLKKYGKVTPKELNFETYTLDFDAGQKLTVNLSEFGMSSNEYFLIEEVNITDTVGIDGTGNIILKAEIKGTSRAESDFSTQHSENWIDVFASFQKTGSGGNTIINNGSGVGISVGPSAPNNPKTNDLWLDTDDYTEHQITTKTTNANLTAAEAGIIIINSSGSTSQTLPTLTNSEDNKIEYYFKNIGTGTATITGTVDGITNPTLKQYMTMHIAWDGTSWIIVNGSNTTAKFGDSINISLFERDGTLVFENDARTYRDELGDVSRLRVVGVGINQNDTESTMDFLTSANLSDYLWANVQLNHDRDLSTNIYPHIHWFQVENNVPNFLLEYRWQINGGSKTTSWTRIKCNTAVHTYSSGTIHQICKTTSGISVPVGTTLSDILQVRILRDNGNTSTLFTGADPYSTTAPVMSFDVHIVTNTIGSRTEYSK